jgi:WS/DGAT/MGAT family acyltransferase
MAQQHLDRLTPIDAGFLHQEGPSAHMHIGALLIFEGAPPPFEDLLDHIRSRLHLVPRYRQKLATPPFETGRPLWIDDSSFNLEFHVRHTALPAPRTEAQLLALVSRIASQPLDRTKPLWEFWMVEGLEGTAEAGGERFAMICKTHHALVDGVSGVDLATVLFDLGPEPVPLPDDLEPWVPHREPSTAELAVASVRDTLESVVGAVAHGMAAAVQPARTIGKLGDAIEGLAEIAWQLMNPAPRTPLNVEIGPHRRFTVVRQRLADYRTVKNALGGTVNDVMLAVVSGALADWLHTRGVRTDGLELRALVPVSVRTADQRHTLGNKLTVMRGPLPVYVRDPSARLEVVRRAMDGLKESKQAVGAATLTAVETFAPPTLLAQASRLNFSTRLFNLLVTNVPGPQIPLYLLGRELADLIPIAFLPENHALAVAIMSYNGAIEYGLIGDYDALSDIDVVADGIDRALAELLDAAREQASRAERRERVAGVRDRRADGAPTPVDRTREVLEVADANEGALTSTAPEAERGDGAESLADLTAALNGDDQSAWSVAPGSRPDGVGDTDQVPEPIAEEPAPILPKARRRTPPGPASEMRARRARVRDEPRREPPRNQNG